MRSELYQHPSKQSTSQRSIKRSTGRFTALGLVPFLAITGLLILFWQLNPPTLLAQTSQTPEFVVRYVSPDGSGSSCTTANPCALQTAVTLSAIDAIEVRALEGVYTSTVGMPTVQITRSVTLLGGYSAPGWGGPDPDLYPSILQGNNGRVIEIDNNATPTISGFHITNGSAVEGAGIYIISGSPTITNNQIYQNSTNGSGAGIFVRFGAQANILFNDIYNNTASGTNGQGAGVYVGGTDASAFLDGNSIYNNGATNGGGLFVAIAGEATSQNNFIYDNSASQSGGGVRVIGSWHSIHDTLVANHANSGGGGAHIFNGTAVITNSIVASNTANVGFTGIDLASATVTGDYNNIFGNTVHGSVLFPNIVTTNPQFINYGIRNLHLSQSSANVDAGTTTAVDHDIDQQARPQGPAVDLGADEFYPNIPGFSFQPTRIDHLYADRGTTQNYDHRLTNENSTDDDTYTFVCSNSQGWSVSCPTPQAVPLGGYITVTTQLDVPAAAAALSVGDTIITATSAVDPSLSHAVLVRTVVRPVPGVQFTPNYSTTIQPGEVITLNHTLTNTGDAPDVFTITLEDNSLGWADIVPQEPLQVPLGIGASTTIRVRVTVPPQAAGQIPNEAIVRATSMYDTAVFAEVTDLVRAEQTIGTRYVRQTTSSDTNNNCTQANSPCATVSHALGQAVTNDELRIAFGTYPMNATTEINETVHLSGGWTNNFQEQGTQPTIIQPASTPFQLFTLAGAANRSSFSHLTIQGGAAGAARGGALSISAGAQVSFDYVTLTGNSAERGGAINISGNSFATIENSQVTTNTSSFHGGAIHVENGTLIIRKSNFEANQTTGGSAPNGGAIYATNTLLVLENSLLNDNTAVGNGGGLFAQNSSSTLNHNTIVNNNATNGAGLYVNNSGGQAFYMVNSIVADNDASGQAGAIFVDNGSITGDYVNIWGNSTPETVGTIDFLNDFAFNPTFADDQFRLAATSPLVDLRPRQVGNIDDQLSEDFEEDGRPSDHGYDLGYDELAGCSAKRDDTIFGSIQEAVDMPGATSNTILVSGICRGVNSIDVDGDIISQTVHITSSTPITIQGGWSADFGEQLLAETTLIDPQQRGRALYISDPAVVTLEFLTLVNGTAVGLGGGPAGENAGGLVYNHGGSLTLNGVSLITGTAVLGGALYHDSGNTETDFLSLGTETVKTRFNANSASNQGGAIYINSGTVLLNGAIITDNTAVDGGGFYHAGGNLNVTNAVFAYNDASGDGGAGYNMAPPPGNASVLHATFYENNAGSEGGALYNLSNRPLVVRNNIFQENDAPTGDAIFAGSNQVDENYNYYHGQPAPIAGGLSMGSNSINSSTPPGLVDPVEGDYHLQNTAAAADQGDPLSPVLEDYEGDIRPSNQGPDMGADEIAGCWANLNDVIYGNLQEAINQAQPGDVILVAGTCSGVHEFDTGGPAGGCRGNAVDAGIIRTTLHIDKNVTLQGGWDEQFNQQDSETVLDALGMGRVVHFAPGVTAVLDRFHIVNGSLDGTNGNGAGICIDNASPTIRNNQIFDNVSRNGAGIYAINSGATIDGNRIYSNNATAEPTSDGGGLYVTGSTTAVSVVNNFVYSNTASTNGGGIFSQSGANELWHNTVVANIANNQGAGVYVQTGSPVIRNNIFSSNNSPSTGGIYGFAGSTPSIGYNNFFGHLIDLGGTAIDNGSNQFANPLLSPQTYTLTVQSPALDAGDPTAVLDHDYEEDTRPSNLGFDLGADEVLGCVARNMDAPTVIYSSLQAAVDAADPIGDIIQVDGICLNAKAHPDSSSSVQNLFVNKEIGFDGNWDSGLIPGHNGISATLNALDNGRVLYISANGYVTMTNFILVNGDANGAGLNDNGGGIYNDGTLALYNVSIDGNTAVNGAGIYNNANLTISHSVIRNNLGTGHGGGLYNANGTAVVDRANDITGNSTVGNGGAIYQAGGDLLVDSNNIHHNSAPIAQGGAIYLAGSNPATLRNNFIYNNQATAGGGLYNHNTNSPIWHNTFYQNTASGGSGAGIYSVPAITIRSNIVDFNNGSGIHVSTAGADIDFNNVVGHSFNYSGNAAAGANDISHTPLYVDPTTGNFHLQSTSPGIDNADPNVPFAHDIDGHLRPTNGGPDRGADELNSCLIRVIDPSNNTPHIFGVLQDAIDFAESFPELPTVEIARGECSGVQFDSATNTYQVGIIRQNLTFEGSLRRLDFQYDDDYTSQAVGTVSSQIIANHDGRVLYIANGANPTFHHLAFVQGDAAAGGGPAQGGGIYVEGSGSLEMWSSFVCDSTAVDGGGIYLASGAPTEETYITGSTIGACVPMHVEENANGSVNGDLSYYMPYLGNTASNDGGGMYANNNFDVSNTGFLLNEAGNNGGGLYNNSSNTYIINGVFYSNTALNQGGGVYNTGNNFHLYHNTVSSNEAGNTGGGIYNLAPANGFILNSSIVYANRDSTGNGSSSGLNMVSSDEQLAYNNFYDNGSTVGVGSNHINGDPQLTPFAPDLTSPVIDQADPALLDPGVPLPGGDFLPVDFDANLYGRPDGGTIHQATRASDIGAFEWWKDFGCSVTVTPQQANIQPGEVATYYFDVTNTGWLTPPASHRNGFTDTITISLTTSAGWGALDNGDTQTFVDMAWDETRPITLSVLVPLDAQSGDFDLSTIMCQSASKPEQTNTGQATTYVGEVSGVIVFPDYNTSARPNEQLLFTHTVQNIGNETETFVIRPSAGLQHASAVLLENSDPVTEKIVTLSPNQTVDVLLQVTILETALRDEFATPGVVAQQIDDPLNTGAAQNSILILGEPATRYVAPGGDNVANNCTNSADPCGTIEHAIFAAEPNDPILVAQGTYNDSSSHQIGGDTYLQNVFIDKSVEIHGGFSTLDDFSSQHPITQTTRLDGEGVRRVFYMTPTITVTLSGLFIENGFAESSGNGDYGGGIYNAGADLTITTTFVLSNSAEFGAGLYQTDANLTVNSSVFAYNTDIHVNSVAGTGGGIFVEEATAVIDNNTFVQNRMVGDDSPEGYGAAVYVGDNGSLTSRNNIFSQNETAGSPAIGSAEYVTATATLVESDYNLYWLNNTNFVTGTNSLIGEPQFIDPFFHIGPTSPAKDAGNNVISQTWPVDYDIEDRVMGNGIDIGADERFQRPEFTVTPITATAVITTEQIYTYTHVLQNTGDPSDSYSLSMVNVPVTPNGDWGYTLAPTQTGTLDSGDSITFTLVITGSVPGSIDETLITVDSDNFDLSVVVTNSTTVSFTPGVDIEASLTADGIPGMPTVYNHVLTNTGDGIDQYELNLLSAAPADWLVTITPTQTGYLEMGDSMPFTVTVTPPAGTAAGVVHTVEVEAQSLNSLGIVATDILTDVTTVIASPALMLTPTAQTTTASEGSTVIFNHTLQNVGNVADTATLAVTGLPTGWSVSVSPASVQLDPLETAAVTVMVIVPNGVAGLTHQSFVTATSTADPAITATAVDTTIVPTSAGVSIEPDHYRIVDAGNTETYIHTVTNLGNTADQFDLTAVSTLTWTTTIVPSNVTLGVGESALVTVTVATPPEALPGQENITTVTAQSASDPFAVDTASDTTRIRQIHDLAFTSDESGTGDPGTSINYTHWLTNTGNGTDTFTFTAVSQNNWNTSTPPDVTLNAGESTAVVVSLDIPNGAAGRTEIMTVTASSVISPAYTASVIDTTTVSGTIGNLGVVIEPDNSSSAAPGTMVTYQHIMTNTGDILEDFNLSAQSSNGWYVTVSPLTILLNPGETASVQIVLTIPMTATGGDSDVVTVTAVSQTDASVFDTALDSTQVLGDTGYGVLIEPDQTGTANAGSSISYTHWVTNTGIQPDSYDLTAVSSHNWLADVTPAQLSLAPGESASVVASLTIPIGAITSTDTMTVTAVSVNEPTVSDTAVDTTQVNGLPGVRTVIIEPDNSGSANTGTTIQYQHTVTNSGTITDEYTLTAVSSQGWPIVTIPALGDRFELAPGQTTSIIVRVTVPANTVTGTVDVTTVTVNSTGSNATDFATDTTTALAGPSGPTSLYLPIIIRDTSPVEPTPTPPPGTPTPTPPPGTPTVTPPPSTPTPGPSPTPCAPHTGIDLVVTQIQVEPAAPEAGVPAMVYVTIRNQGSVNVPFGNNFFVDLYVDRQPQLYLIGDVVWGVQGADLPAGASQTFSTEYTFTGGNHQLWAQVDTDQNVNECPNEHNNILGPVTVPVAGEAFDGPSLVVPQYGPRETPQSLWSNPASTPTPVGTVWIGAPLATETAVAPPNHTPQPPSD